MLASPVRGWKKQDTHTDSCGYDAIPFWIIPMPFMQGAVPAGEVLMAILDDVIGVFSPGWKAARLRSRAVIQAYEAVKTTRTHKARRENRTADQLSQYGAVSLREQAR